MQLGTTQSKQHKARIAAWEILVQYTHFKVYRYEPLIIALLKVIEDVHKKLTTESLLNLMLI